MAHLVSVTLLTLFAFAGSAHASNSSFDEDQALLASRLASCSSTHTDFSDGTGCVLKSVGNSALFEWLSGLVGAQGKQTFGEHFSLQTDKMQYSESAGWRGSVDAVIPVMEFTQVRGGGRKLSLSGKSRSFFIQQGLTHWTDVHGLSRNDGRVGAVYRFSPFNKSDKTIVGVSTFIQESLELGHRRVVSNIDYDGAWGRGAFNYFLPVSDWKASRTQANMEERPLEGMEFVVYLQPTTVIGVDAAMTRWQNTTNTDEWVVGARLGLDWDMHSYINMVSRQWRIL